MNHLLNARKKGVEELISYTIVTDKPAIISLLKRNGVKLSANPSNAELTTAVLVANRRSRIFRRDLSKLLENKLPKAAKEFKNIVGNSEDFGFTGVDDVTYMQGFTGVDDFSDFTGWDDFQSMSGYVSPSLASGVQNVAKTSKKDLRKQSRATRRSSREKTKVGSFLANLSSTLFTKENVNAGIQYGLDRINADSLARQNALQEKAMALEAQQQDIQRQLGKGSGISGTTVLYIGIGVVALVGIGFLIFRKKA